MLGHNALPRILSLRWLVLFLRRMSWIDGHHFSSVRLLNSVTKLLKVFYRLVHETVLIILWVLCFINIVTRYNINLINIIFLSVLAFLEEPEWFEVVWNWHRGWGCDMLFLWRFVRRWWSYWSDVCFQFLILLFELNLGITRYLNTVPTNFSYLWLV